MRVKEYLFSYGTLQKEKVQLVLFKRILQSSGDTLRGYTIATIEIKDESFLSKEEQKYQLTATISGGNNDCINGTVLEITKEELLLADTYEPDNYKRIKILLDQSQAIPNIQPRRSRNTTHTKIITEN